MDKKKLACLYQFFNRPLTFWTIIFCIITLNCFLYLESEDDHFSNHQSRQDASGFSMDKAEHFLYFYYYTGNFPLTTLNTNLTYSKQGAIDEIRQNGEQLIMEYQHWSRLGENARILAFLPNAYLQGSAKNPSIKLFNAIIFTLALLILFVGFYKVKLGLAGFLLLLSINFTPFFLFEIYTNPNIFGLPGSTFFMVLGLNFPILFSKYSTSLKFILMAVISGLIIGFFSEIRNEISVIILSPLILYLFVKNQSIIIRIGCIIVLYLSFSFTKSIIRSHFNEKFEETTTLVTKVGGHPYTGDRIDGHKIWHPVFCGLGDYDTKYGYQWDDRIAYAYAVPVLNEKYDLAINYSGKYHTDNYYDKDSLYYVKFDEISIYEDVIKNKVLSNIKSDPLWYAEILFKRIGKIFTTCLPFSYLGWLLLPLLGWLIIKKKWCYLALLIAALPLSLTSLIIYSGKGNTYNSVFGYMILIILFLWLSERYATIETKKKKL